MKTLMAALRKHAGAITGTVFATGAVLVIGCATQPSLRTTENGLRKALTFYAGFNHGPDAEFSKGSGTFFHAPNMRQPRTGAPGLPASGYVTILPGAGKFGDALRFHRKSEEMVFFEARENVSYQPTNWSGTVSFWLKVDPETELAPGFTDPIQITPRDWNDAAFFVEFGKDEKPRHFRLGAYADLKVWNPENRKFDTLTMAEKPLLGVERPPFTKEKWTHVVFTWEKFNTGKRDSVAKLYLDGVDQGSLTNWNQTFTWDPTKTKIMLGLSFVGLWDELNIFDRPLTRHEIRYLRDLEEPLHRGEK